MADQRCASRQQDSPDIAALEDRMASPPDPQPLISRSDMQVVGRVLDIRSGYVLDFSDRTFDEFLAFEVGVYATAPRFSEDGGSKARLRRILPSLFALAESPPHLYTKKAFQASSPITQPAERRLFSLGMRTLSPPLELKLPHDGIIACGGEGQASSR